MPNPETVIEWWEGASEQVIRDEFAKRWPNVAVVFGGVPVMRKRIIDQIMAGFDEEM